MMERRSCKLINTCICIYIYRTISSFESSSSSSFVFLAGDATFFFLPFFWTGGFTVDDIFQLYSNTFHCIQCVDTKPFSPIYNIKVRFLTFLQYFFRGRFLYLSSLIFPLHQERSHNQSVSNFLDSLKRNDSRL